MIKMIAETNLARRHPTITPKERDFPYEREHIYQPPHEVAVAYLVGYLGEIDKEQAEIIGDVLYQDRLRGRLRSLDQVLSDTGIVDGRKPQNDVVLRNLALDYSLREMEQRFPTEPIKLDGRAWKPMSPGDWFAGEGSGRPLLHQLYKQTSNTLWMQQDREGSFHLGPHTEEMYKHSIPIIFRGMDPYLTEHGLMVVTRGNNDSQMPR